MRHYADTNTVNSVSERTHTHPASILKSLFLKLVSVSTAPFSRFEASSSFWPETYAILDIGPQAICDTFDIVDKNPTLIIYTQDLFVAKSQRHWVRIKLRTTVGIGTAQWKIVAGCQVTPSYAVMRSIPRNVVSLIQSVLSDHPEVKEDTEVNISFEKPRDAATYDGNPTATSIVRTLNISASHNNQTAETFRHHNLPMIRETSIVTAYLQGSLLVANVDKRWVLYRTLTADTLSSGIIWQQIQSGIALRGARHVAQVVGIVLDSEGTLVKGVLVELPAKGPLFPLLLKQSRQGKPVPWPVRQKWAKQITQGVAAIHDRRQVIGGLRTYNGCVNIDEHDNAMIVPYSHGEHPVKHGQNGLLPPEYRTEVFARGNGQVSPEFDLFQLGMLLWHLYRSQDQQGARDRNLFVIAVVGDARMLITFATSVITVTTICVVSASPGENIAWTGVMCWRDCTISRSGTVSLAEGSDTIPAPTKGATAKKLSHRPTAKCVENHCLQKLQLPGMLTCSTYLALSRERKMPRD
jgi:hypothetical protein